MRENRRLTFIMDMVDKLTTPATNATKSLRGLGADVTATQKKLAGLDKQAGQIRGLERMRTEMVRHQTTTKQAAERLARLERAYATTGKASGVTQAQISRARKEHEKAVKTTGEHRQALDQLEGGLRRAGVNTNNLQEATRRNYQAQAQATNELRKQQAALDAATKKQDALTKAKDRYAKSEAAAHKAMASGGKMMAGGAAIAAGTYLAGSPYRDFDAQMSAVQATGAMSGADKERLAKLARDEAKISSFGATEVASSQEYLAMAGYSVSDIEAAQRAVLNLASATNTSLASTADIATNIQGGFGLTADEIGRVSDILTKVTTSSNTNLTELGGAMKYVGPVAKSAGYEIESVAAAAGLLANVGIKDSQAGTALRAAITRMAALPKAAKKAFAELKVDTMDAAGNMRPLEDVLVDVAKATDGMGTGKKTALIAKMFGVEASAGLGELLAKSTGAELEAFIDKIRNSNGATDQAAATRLKNLDGDIKVMMSGVEELRLKFGESFDLMYRGIVRFATKAIAAVDGWMERNPKLVKSLGLIATALGIVMSATGAVIVALGALWLMGAKVRLMWFLMRWAALDVVKAVVMKTAAVAATAAGYAWALVKGVAWLAWMVTSRTAMAAWAVTCGIVKVAMAALNVVMSMNPIGLLIVAIGALVAAGIWLYQNWDRLPEIFDNLWEKVKGFAGFDPMEMIKGAWDAVGDYFSGLFGGIWDSFIGVFSKIGDKLASLGSWATGGFGFFDDEVKEQVKDAPKAGEEAPKVNGKPLTKGNQVTQTKQQIVNVTPAPVNITIQSSGGDAQEIARQIKIALDQRDREAAREARGAYRDT